MRSYSLRVVEDGGAGSEWRRDGLALPVCAAIEDVREVVATCREGGVAGHSACGCAAGGAETEQTDSTARGRAAAGRVKRIDAQAVLPHLPSAGRRQELAPG